MSNPMGGNWDPGTAGCWLNEGSAFPGRLVEPLDVPELDWLVGEELVLLYEMPGVLKPELPSGWGGDVVAVLG